MSEHGWQGPELEDMSLAVYLLHFMSIRWLCIVIGGEGMEHLNMGRLG